MEIALHPAQLWTTQAVQNWRATPDKYWLQYTIIFADIFANTSAMPKSDHLQEVIWYQASLSQKEHFCHKVTATSSFGQSDFFRSFIYECKCFTDIKNVVFKRGLAKKAAEIAKPIT